MAVPSALRLAPLLLLLAACLPGRRAREGAPVALDARAVAVYRTVADSIYVRTTGQRIAIAATTLDAGCAEAECPSLAQRWGIDRMWWTEADTADLRLAVADLARRAAHRRSLAPVVEGAAGLFLTPGDSSPAPFAPKERWLAFRDANGGAVGILHFSPVGFSRSRRTAVVHVDWRCGPTCGHRLAAMLVPTGDSTWRVANMLLLPPDSAVAPVEVGAGDP